MVKSYAARPGDVARIIGSARGCGSAGRAGEEGETALGGEGGRGVSFS